MERTSNQDVTIRAMSYIGGETVLPEKLNTPAALISLISQALAFYAGTQKQDSVACPAIYIENNLFASIMPSLIEAQKVVAAPETPYGDGQSSFFKFSGYTFVGRPIFVIPTSFAGRIDLLVGDLWSFVKYWYAPAIKAYRRMTPQEVEECQERKVAADKAKKEQEAKAAKEAKKGEEKDAKA